MFKKNRLHYLLASFVLLSLVGCGGGGSADLGGGTPPVTNTTKITGRIIKGQAIAGSVSVYKKDGTPIGTDKTFVDGGYSIPNTRNYSGPVKVVAIITKYHDEMSKQDVSVSDFNMSAISSVSTASDVVNVTPLTEVAARLLGDNALSDKNITKAKIAEVNKYVAKVSGITSDYNPAKDSVVSFNKGAGEQSDSAENRNGVVLLAISKDSNLTPNEANTSKSGTQVNNAIDKFYTALLKAPDDNATALKAIVEDLNDTGVKIKDVNNSDIITETNVIPSNNISDLVNKAKKAVKALAKIANYADSNSNPTPTVQDYTDAGVTGINASNLNAVNAKVDGVAKIDADTATEVQALINAVNATTDALAKIANYADNNTNPTPTLQDYSNAGVIGVNTANLNAVNAKVNASNRAGANTVAEVQALVDAGNTTTKNALAKIANYADNNTNPTPTVQDYTDAGVTGVDATNLSAVNAKVDGVAKIDADTVAEVQVLADVVNTTTEKALTKISAYADDNTNQTPTVQDYINVGVKGVGVANLSAVNAKVDGVAKVDVDTVTKIQALVNGVNATADPLVKIENYAENHNNPIPTVQDYTNAGITGVDAANLHAVNAKVDASNATQTDTIAGVQDLADAGNTIADNALTKIANYADNSTNPTPTVQDYTDAGVAGVDVANLNAVNAKVHASNATDTVVKIQTLANAGNIIADALAKIANYADSSNNPTLTLQDYTDAGVTGVDAANLNAVNAQVDASNKAGANTVTEIQALANAGNTIADNALTKIANYADNSTNPTPTVQDYTDAGVIGVDVANLNAVNAKIDASNKAGANTVAEVQTLADAGNTIADNALTKIAKYADDNTNPTPTVQDYTDAGVTSVDAANLKAVNAKVDASNKAGANTVAEVQALADAGNTIADNALTKIANYADNNSTNPTPTVQDYTDAGVTGVDVANLNAVNAQVDASNKAAANTVAEIQALADAGNTIADNALAKIANYADSKSNQTPTLQDYLNAGVTGVDAANLNAVNAKVDGVAKVDADTVAKIQALTDAGNITVDTALVKIANYADSNTNPTPTLQDYTDAGVTGVNVANLNAVNAKVEGVAKIDADTVAKIQAFIGVIKTTADALAKIANYADSKSNQTPTLQDYLNAGVRGVNASNLNAVNAKVDGVVKVDADTVAEVQTLTDVVNATADTALAKISAYAANSTNPAPTVQDYTDAGVTGVDTANLSAVNTKVDASDAAGTDTVVGVQALADAINTTISTALTKITNYADGSSSQVPTVQDYTDAGVIGVDVANLNAVNAKVHASNATDTVAKLQALADAGNTIADALIKISTYTANSTNPAPTVQDYINAGVTGVDAVNLYAVNAAVDASDATDTVAKVQALANAGSVTANTALAKITNYADKNTNPIPTVQDYANAGVTGVDAVNLHAVNALVDASDAAETDTVAGVQALANAGNVTANTALTKIANYADNNSTNPTPTVQDYTDAGVIGVDAANLNAVNAKVDASNRAGANTVTEIQALANAGNTIADALAKIANYANNSSNPIPTVQDYTDAGVIGVDATNLSTVSAAVDASDTADTVAIIQTLVDTAKAKADAALTKIANYAEDNNNSIPTLQDYTDAGVTDVDAANLNAVNAKVDGAKKVDANAVTKIQVLANAGNVIADTALAKIAGYADGSSNATPTVQDYTDAGVTDVDTANLNAVNAAVDASDIADTVAKIQVLANAGNVTADTALTKIASYAEDNNNSIPTLQDYTDAGVTGVDTANLNAVNAAVDASDIADTVTKIQALTDAVNVIVNNALANITNYADNNSSNPTPTLEDYTNAGVTGVDAANLDAVNVAIDASNAVGTATVTKVQAVVNGVNAAADGLTKIANYADNSSTNSAPTVQDYIDAGVTGVDTANLSAVNAKVDGVAKVDADTATEVQTLVDAVNKIVDDALTKISAYAADSTNEDPTVKDYTDAGVTGVSADNLAAVNAAVSASNTASTVAEVQAIVDGGADVTKSTVTVYSNTVIADNTTTTIIELQAKDSNGTNITTGAETVVFDQNGSASISTVVDNNGTYMATIKNTAAQTVEINATIGGEAVIDTAIVTFTPDANITTSIVDVNASNVVADGTAQATITLQAKDSGDNNITTGAETVVFDQNGSATISEVTDHDNGTYTATITDNAPESVTIRATIGGEAVTDTANITFHPKPFPANITIDDNLTAIIASVNDNTPYNPAVNVQGVIDMNATGKAVSIPYTVVNNSATLPAYSTTSTIERSATADNESGIIATFAWAEQTDLPVGRGRFTAHITIDDSAGNRDNVYKAKQLDVEDNASGIVAATFDYPTDNNGTKGALTLKIMPGVPDRMFGAADNKHNFLYLPVTNPTTGKTWLNNNLGAEYADVNSTNFDPAQQATDSNDSKAYGSLFQWGRKADGHELIKWSDDGSTGSGVNNTTNTNANNPTDALFITEGSSPFDWRKDQNDTLWANEASVNNVCPRGYRLPLNPNGANDTENEWFQEKKTWGETNTAGAIASELRLTTPGRRNRSDGTIEQIKDGFYWSGSASGTEALYIHIQSGDVGPNDNNNRAFGMTVRCIKN